MTFPLAETLQGDITELYLFKYCLNDRRANLFKILGFFRKGLSRPLIWNFSVSRIGNKVQCPAIR